MTGPSKHRATSLQADQAVAALYEAHYRALVRTASLLIADPTAAEDIVQASFAAMHRAWFRLGSQDKALAYLCRELIRHVRARVRGKPARASSLADMPAIAILSSLPVRQREVLVLRYFAGLSEIQIAEAVGVRPQAVTRHLSCGLAAYHDGAG